MLKHMLWVLKQKNCFNMTVLLSIQTYVKKKLQFNAKKLTILTVNTYLVDIFILLVKHDFHLALCIRIQLCIGAD